MHMVPDGKRSRHHYLQLLPLLLDLLLLLRVFVLEDQVWNGTKLPVLVQKLRRFLPIPWCCREQSVHNFMIALPDVDKY